MKEVAKAAGVSTQTVSRVLNKRPDVAPETIQRVQQIMDETGYAPNILARSLKGRSRTLGVVAYGLDYFGPSRVTTGIEEQANELGYSIFLNLLHHPETNDIDDLLKNLLAHQVEGIIWAIPEIGNNRAWAQARTPDLPIPVMFVSGMTGPSTLPLVGIDNCAIGRLATKHLLAGGARQIGIITGPPAWWETQQRQEGWRKTLAEHGLAAEERLVVAGDWSAQSGEQGLYRLLDQCPTLDAVFASNDQMALGVLHAAHRLGRRVPEDLSIAGVDNIPESAHFWPPLTTIRQRLREAGAQAVQQLDQMIRNAEPAKYGQDGQDGNIPNIALLEPELVVRESTLRPESTLPPLSS
jgi:LacI family transcriptional regulator